MIFPKLIVFHIQNPIVQFKCCCPLAIGWEMVCLNILLLKFLMECCNLNQVFCQAYRGSKSLVLHYSSWDMPEFWKKGILKAITFFLKRVKGNINHRRNKISRKAFTMMTLVSITNTTLSGNPGIPTTVKLLLTAITLTVKQPLNRNSFISRRASSLLLLH